MESLAASSDNANKRDQRKKLEHERKREDIADAASRVIAKQGFYQTKMEDVARECGHAVGSLYKYFKSKDEVYVYLIRNRLNRLQLRLQPHWSAQETVRIRCQRIFGEFLSFFEGERDFFKIYVNEIRGFQWDIRGEVGQEAFERYQSLLRRFTELFEEGRKKGELRNSVSAENMAVIIVGMMNAFFTQLVLQDGTSPQQGAQAQALMDLYFDGCAHEGQR